MHQRKSKKVLIYFFLLITVSSISNFSFNNFKLSKIQNVNISGLEQKDNQILLNKINNLKLENIFSLNKKEIEKLINSNLLVERFEVFKKYPSTININIEKTNFYARINDNGKTFLIGSNGKLIPAKNINHDLPYIFGKTSIEEFLKFKRIIDKSKFSYDQIQSLYFFPSKRWDLKLKENILLKLPSKVTNENLDNLHEFLKNYNIKKFNIIDLRIKNQIILNE